MPGLAPLKTRRPSAHLRRPETAAELEYVSVGCNRSVHGADWNHEDAPGGGLVAYGAHKAVAVYDPAGARVLRTLPGHDAPVTVVRWIPDAHAPGRWLVSGDADGAVILWHRTDHPARLPDDAGSGADGDDASAGDAERPLDPEAHRWRVVAKRKAHEGPVLDARAERAFATPGDPTSVRLLVTASQDGQVRLWRLDLDLAPAPAPAPASAAADAAAGEAAPARAPLAARGRLRFPPRRAPLSAALARLPRTDRLVLAVGGADGGVRLFLCDTSELTSRESDESENLAEDKEAGVDVEACATLAGHADWVRDLAFAADDDAVSQPGLLLASASQDRTARVWRVRVAYAAADDGSASGLGCPAYARLARPPPPPSALLGGAARVAADLEAVLQGHEDWVMSVAWRPDAAKAFVVHGGSHASSSQLSLLTASADRSLIHWTPVSDPTAPRDGGPGPESRVWMASESVGDAASSCLGFYGAMFDARARRVLAHAHGGALHAWRRAGSKAAGGDERWAPAPASAGHAGEVTSLSWDAAGRFLLSGSVDMTARAHASWESRVDETFLSDLRDVHKPVTLTLDAPTTGWREIARPQIHGHAVTCVAALPPAASARTLGGGEEKAEAKTDAATLAGGSVVFVSGADEKTLRVFDAPGTFLGTLARSLPRSDRAGRRALEAARERAADASGGAELPQLGLSNKALRAPEAPPEPSPPEPVPETPSAEPAERAERVGASGSPRSGGGGGEEGSASSFSFASFAGEHGFGVDPDPTNSLLPPESAPAKSPARRRRDGVIEGERRQDVIMLTPERPSEGASASSLGDDDTTPVVKARSGAADAAGVSSDAPPRLPDSSFVRAETPKRPKRSGDSAAKATAEPAAGERGGDARVNGESARDGDTFGSVTPAVLSRPPAEEALASATLWPEARKLYGHGDDVSCVAAHPSGALVASACEARSASAASIWVWDASKDWRPLGKLAGATLTVVALHFASPARAATPAGAAGSPGFFGAASSASGASAAGSRAPERSALLAASRDRHISIYVPSLTSVADGTGAGAWGGGWTLATRVKAHAKALYDAEWAPVGHDAFATAGRDKRVKVWRVDDQSAASADESIAPFACAATAVAFAPRRVRGKLILAVGLEDGGVRLLAGEPRLGPSSARRDRPAGPNWTVTCSVDARDAHAGAVRALAWRPWGEARGGEPARGSATDGGAASGAASDADESDSQSGSPVFSFFGLSLADPEEEDDEADGPMTLASCGADHSVRLFAVRRAGGSGMTPGSAGRAARGTPGGGGEPSPLGKPAKEDSTSALGAFFGFA